MSGDTVEQLRQYAKLLAEERDDAQRALAIAMAENEILHAGVAAAELRCQELHEQLQEPR